VKTSLIMAVSILTIATIMSTAIAGRLEERKS